MFGNMQLMNYSWRTTYIKASQLAITWLINNDLCRLKWFAQQRSKISFLTRISGIFWETNVSYDWLMVAFESCLSIINHVWYPVHPRNASAKSWHSVSTNLLSRAKSCFKEAGNSFQYFSNCYTCTLKDEYNHCLTSDATIVMSHK